MSWPSTDFEAEIQTEIDNLRAMAAAVGMLIAANEGSGKRTDIAWRNVRAAHAEWDKGEKGSI